MRMKSLLSQYILLIMSIILVFSCKEPVIRDCYIKSGTSVTEVRQTTEFTRLIINGDFQVNVEQSDSCLIIVKSYSNLIDGVITRVDSSTLTIEDDIRCKWIRNQDEQNTIWILMKSLEYIDFRATGNLFSPGTINGDKPLVIEVHDGSGNMDLALDFENIYIYQHIATGNIRISGLCNTLELYTESLGIVDCRTLECYKVIVNHDGSNNIYIFPEYLLNANITSSGNIFYKGNPLVNLNISGNGRLMQIE